MDVSLRPIVVNCDVAAQLLGMTEPAFRKMLQRGIGPNQFSFMGTDIRFLVEEIERWVKKKAGVPVVEAEPKRGRGRPRGTTKKKD